MKVTTKRQADGTYAYILDGVTTPTEAVTPYGARVQGLQMAAWVAGFTARCRANYVPSDLMLTGTPRKG